jgi:hypothetical protein
MGLWNHIRLVAGDRAIPIFPAILVLYTIAESPLESLLESLLESVFKSQLESFLERVLHREEKSFPREALADGNL